MRIFTFLLSAATLHAVLLVLSFENAGQNVDEHLVGVALVQRQWDQPAANAGLEPREPASRASQEEFPVKKTENQQADKKTEKLEETSAQEQVAEEGAPPATVDVSPPVAVEDEAVQKPDVIEPPLEVAEEETQIGSLPSVQQVDEPTAKPEMGSKEAVNSQTQNQPNEPWIKSEHAAVDAAQSDSTNQAALQPVQQQAQPRYGYNPAPAYPRVAHRRGWEGIAELNVKVLSNGRVGEVQLKNSSGYRSLDNAARRAILTWRFNPAIRYGREVESWVVVPVHFVLDGRSAAR